MPSEKVPMLISLKAAKPGKFSSSIFVTVGEVRHTVRLASHTTYSLTLADDKPSYDESSDTFLIDVLDRRSKEPTLIPTFVANGTVVNPSGRYPRYRIPVAANDFDGRKVCRIVVFEGAKEISHMSVELRKNGELSLLTPHVTIRKGKLRFVVDGDVESLTDASFAIQGENTTHALTAEIRFVGATAIVTATFDSASNSVSRDGKYIMAVGDLKFPIDIAVQRQ